MNGVSNFDGANLATVVLLVTIIVVVDFVQF